MEIETVEKQAKILNFQEFKIVTSRWGCFRISDFIPGGRDIRNQDLKTLLTFGSASERIESVPRGLRNSQPPKQ